MTTRHEFLAQLHELLRPKVYLEVGVQHGWSLQLSKAQVSIGVDPKPLITASQLNMPNEVLLATMTSDEFFETYPLLDYVNGRGFIDLAFIDGMHLAEYAWRDFGNISRYCHAGSVVVFDDVLPTTTNMANRQQCPGDWTGDVWKLYYELRADTRLVVVLVDTTPTGTLIVTGFDEVLWTDDREFLFNPMNSRYLDQDEPVPSDILDRRHAWSAPAVIENLKDRGFGR